MENLKQEAINAILKMPAADIDEIMYRLYVIDKVRKGRRRRKIKERNRVMVKWSRAAGMDLNQIHDYIAKDSKYYANYSLLKKEHYKYWKQNI